MYYEWNSQTVLQNNVYNRANKSVMFTTMIIDPLSEKNYIHKAHIGYLQITMYNFVSHSWNTHAMQQATVL